MTKFIDLGLAEPVLRAIKELGYETPTPIQAQAIPALLDGEDMVGIAQTGTGKTAAFVLPLIDEIAVEQENPRPKTCHALILAPTRELAAQIHESVQTYGKYVKMRSTIVMGGVKPGRQIKALSQGVNILVATPGRLIDHMQTGAVRLDDTTVMILDEADQMLDMGFLPAIRKVMQALPKERQTLLFSATMPKPIRILAKDFLTNPKEVAVKPQSTPIERIHQSLIYADQPQKAQLTIDYLQNAGIERAIVFTRTKHGADKLTRLIERAGMKVGAIHGNKSQNQRIRTLDAFKDYKLHVLVATDIAARGIDIDGVSHVVNHDLPNVPEAYVHRIGRTARAGKSGTAIAFCSEEERLLLKDIEKTIGMTLPKTLADGTPTEALPITITKKPGSGGGGRRRSGGSGNRAKGGGRGRGGAKGSSYNASKDTAKPKHRRKRKPQPAK